MTTGNGTRLDDGIGHRSREKGKRVIVWEFRGDGGKLIAMVEVFLRPPKGDDKDLRLVAISSKLGEPVVNTDIAALHRDVEDHLARRYDIDNGINWEDWLEVKVFGELHERLGERYYDNVKADFGVEYRRIRRGTTTAGRVVTLNGNGSIADFPNPQRYAEADANSRGPGRIRLNTPYEISFVPATEENLRALAALAAEVAKLRDRAVDLMQQSSIQGWLNRAAAGPLLTHEQTKDAG